MPQRTPIDRLTSCLDAILVPLARQRETPLERVRLAWTHILGAPLARHAEPLGFERGLLIIGARGPDWREALYVQRASIRRRLRGVLSDSRGFKLRTIARAPAARRVPPPPPRPQHPATLEIADAPLATALSDLLHARAARDAGDAR